MRQAPDDRHGARLRALIVNRRGGLRVQEALALGERDLDPRRGSLLVRCGKGGRRREIGLDAWGREQLQSRLAARVEPPVAPLFCVIGGPTQGRSCSSAGVRVEFRRLGAQAGVRRRFAPHQLRHAHAVELVRACRSCHPTPARPCQPRHDEHLPTGNRHRGDHRHCARPAGADDVRQRRTPALTSTPNGGAFTPAVLPPTLLGMTAPRRRASVANGAPPADRHTSCSSRASRLG
jgi:integrase